MPSVINQDSVDEFVCMLMLDSISLALATKASSVAHALNLRHVDFG